MSMLRLRRGVRSWNMAEIHCTEALLVGGTIDSSMKRLG